MVSSSRPPKNSKETKLFTRESSQQAKEEREIFWGFILIVLLHKHGKETKHKLQVIYLVGFSQSFSNTQEESEKKK